MVVLFAITGLLAALALCAIDFVTSYNGVRAVMPPGTESIILRSIPFLFAVLAITFNGTSAHLFRHFRRGKYGGLASFVLLVVLLSVGWWRLQQGFLTGEIALGALRFVARFGILPVFFFVILLRVFAWRGDPGPSHSPEETSRKSS